MLQSSVRMIHRNESDPVTYLAWARQSLPILLPEITGPSEQDTDIMAFWIGRAIWNATPLESNGYRPRSLPAPKRNEPCPCGSGRKFKHCCRDVPAPPEIEIELVWPILIECLPDKHWIDAARSGALPSMGLYAAASVFLEHERWRSLKELSEAALDDGAAIKAEMAALIDPLCDAYDVLYRTDRKKRELLERLAAHPLDPVRSAANQRLSSWLHDQGERKGAWAALARAQQADPSDPAVAGLEISLLASEHAYDRARERAGFWLRRFQKTAGIPDEVLDFLRAVRADPRRALAEVSRDAAPQPIATLYEWIDQQVHRPVPELSWTPLAEHPDDAWVRDAYEPVPRAEEAVLVAEWRSRSQLDKPFSVHWLSGSEDQAWERFEDWLPWLMAHPAVLDSFEILDDLIMLLLFTEEFAGMIDNPWIEMLVERGARILLEHWPSGRTGTLPWVVAENRPALRVLARAAILQIENEDRESMDFMRAYLRLNPSDNHGLRSLLVNELLKAGQDSEALELTLLYPDDLLAEIVYGRVLALFRTGERGEAINALISAAQELPLVLDYLVRDRVAAPRIDSEAVLLGGKDQAWLYREAMRPTWMGTQGLTEWLKPLAKKIKAKRPR
jgi:hypothetical protein